ncbi:MAG: CRISPR-associated protein Cas2 [Thermoplasmatales archaeon E-plasma]|nr:MAG: CRISPR-associated protein Cas2 [Thermoplasmatales archaeon E-plasma]
MRRRFIVTYDIADPGRLRKIFSLLRGFGESIQYSVFMCELSPKEKAILVTSLHEAINHNEDRIMVIDIGSIEIAAFERIEFIGKVIEITNRECIII